MSKRITAFLLFLITLASLIGTASANNTKLIALTFDDGPSKKITPVLLDELAKRNVHVTFFNVGQYLEYFPEIAAKAAEDGHQLSNHSYSHPWFTKLSEEQIQAELSKTNELIHTHSPKEQIMVRIPYGAMNSGTAQIVNAPIIQWSMDPASGNMNTSEEAMKNNLVSLAKDGAIAILHDTNEKNLNVALYAIDELLAQGYEFVTLRELFRLRGVVPENGVVYYNVPVSSAETHYDETKLSEHWASSYIDYVAGKGIMEGDKAGFNPNAYMTRAMAATILWRMSGSPAAVSISPPPLLFLAVDVNLLAVIFSGYGRSAVSSFTDVPDDMWYTDAVKWAHQKGYVQGMSETLYAPDEFLTKEQFYTMLARFGSKTLQSAPEVLPREYRDDVHISDWAKESILDFRRSGFASKNDIEIFRPLDNISRAECAELISWLLRDCPAA